MSEDRTKAAALHGVVSWLTWPARLLVFVLWMTGRVLTANGRVVVDVLRSRDQAPPVVVAMRSSSCSEGEMALLSVLISLTPGTLVLATDREPRTATLYLHTTVDDRESLLASAHDIEARMLHAVRRGGARDTGGGTA